MAENKLTLYKGEKKTEIDFGVEIYKEAADQGTDVFALLDQKYVADVQPGTTASEQILAQMGMAKAGKVKLGDALDGKVGASIVREGQPASRILSPAVVLKLTEDKLAEDYSSDLAIADKMVGETITIAGKRYEQPLLNFDVPKQGRARPIGQLSLPAVVGTLTVAERQGTIPTLSIGLEISDEAKKAFTFDQVAMDLAHMRQAQEIANLSDNLNSLVAGDEDLALTALTPIAATTYDSTATGGQFTQKALLKWLWANRRSRTIDYVWGTLDTYLAYCARTGRPVTDTLPAVNGEVNANKVKPLNMINNEPAFFIVEDGVVPANTLVGIDSRYAIQKFSNSEANYSATEELVMRKGQQMRFDSGSVLRRWHDEAWSVMSFS